MSRALYTTLLFVMTAIGFGEFRGSLCDQINTAKSKTIEANLASNDAKQAIQLTSGHRPRSTAVAGVRG